MKSVFLPCALLLLFSGMTQAAVSLSGTRLIFDGRFNEATIEVSNRSDAETLIQAWLEPAREDAGRSHSTDLPFVVTPHLVRLPAKGRQTLRLLYEGVGLLQDRESLLHLFVLEIPRRNPAAQQLSIAVRQRINVFYRPAGLLGDPAAAAQALAWQPCQPVGAALCVSNPTPFHVSLQDLRVSGFDVDDYLLLAPFANHSLTLPAGLLKDAAQGSLSFKSMTDYGGRRDHCARFKGGQPFNVPLRMQDSHSLIGKC